MSVTVPNLVFLLDTPNVRRGRALAGTPARTLALAEHSHRAGADVTMVLCDRGADYGTESDWPFDLVVVHPNDFYTADTLVGLLGQATVDFLILCEAESLISIGRDLALLLNARLVYDVHDDDAAVAASLGEPAKTVERHATIQNVALRTADNVIVSTTNEATMAGNAGVPTVRTARLPNGANPQQRHCWGPDIAAATLVFLGNLYYQPNARAVEAIRNTILPELRADDLDIQVRVIGHGPAELTRNGHRVKFTGRVDTIDHGLCGTTLGLAPLTAGSGAKMKVLDYMAAGLPVFGTRESVTGLPPHHPGVIVEDNLRQWASRIVALLRDAAALTEIGRAGRRCIEDELPWQNIGADLTRTCRTWLMTLPPGRNPFIDDHCSSVPRWLTEHANHGVLGDPDTTRPGKARWIRQKPAIALEGRR